MSVLSREALLGATTLPTKRVKVPELGGEVIVRGMSGTERDAFEATLFQGKGKNRVANLANVRAKMVAFCCVDENGVRLFTDADAAQLGEVRADILSRLFAPAQQLSGMSDEDIEEMGKPSESPAPSATSSSVSPVN